MTSPDLPATHTDRFSGIARLYGVDALSYFYNAHVMVIGIGGVGSWVAEALARSGVGRITLVDMDDVCVTNTNRQLHATQTTYGKPKVDAMRDRLASISPDCKIDTQHCFYQEKTVDKLLALGADVWVDCIDGLQAKAHLLATCRAHHQSVVTVGGAGGKVDATAIQTTDLAFTKDDALLALLRKKLRQKHAFPRHKNQKFHIPCVYSPEPRRFPTSCGATTLDKPGDSKTRNLDCQTGFGAATMVTGTFGFFAAQLTLQILLNNLSNER